MKAYVDARDIEARRTQAESIAFLTHELRNPLTTAVLTTAKLRGQARPEDVKLVETMQRNLGRLSELIDSVLLTQKLDAGQMVVAPADIELAPLLESALEAARKVAETKSLAFRANCDASLTARLDPVLTRSAIANLADNAVKYTDAGEVHVEVLDRRDEIVVNVERHLSGPVPEELRTVLRALQARSQRQGRDRPGSGHRSPRRGGTRRLDPRGVSRYDRVPVLDHAAETNRRRSEVTRRKPQRDGV